MWMFNDGVKEEMSDERNPILGRSATLNDAILISVCFLGIFPLCMWDKGTVGFLFVPHMLFVFVAVPVVIIRRVRQFVNWNKRRRLGKIVD